MSSAEDIRASRSASPESNSESQTLGTFGQSSRESWVSYDRDSRSWKTSQGTLLSDLDEFSGTWPNSGMMLNGRCYLLPESEPITSAVASLSSPTCPTPSAVDHKGSGRPRKDRGPGNNLRDWFRQLYGFLYPPVRVVEYLMGFPTDYTALRHSATPLFRKSRKSSDGG